MRNTPYPTTNLSPRIAQFASDAEAWLVNNKCGEPNYNPRHVPVPLSLAVEMLDAAAGVPQPSWEWSLYKWIDHDPGMHAGIVLHYRHNTKM